MSIRTDDLGQAGIRRGEFGVMRFTFVIAGIKIIRAAEIIFRAGAANRRKFSVSIDIKFSLAFTPPTAAVNSPGEICADILATAFDSIEHRVKPFCFEWIFAAEL